MLMLGSECGAGRSISDDSDLGMLTVALTGQTLTGAETNNRVERRGRHSFKILNATRRNQVALSLEMPRDGVFCTRSASHLIFATLPVDTTDSI
jgi:hypothetical protein